jgi:peptidoglycan/LPS O-acetylase OafA/YrhL
VPGGFIGVDVFFVISGFLITRLILEREAVGVFTIRDFYLRRARRILPALCVVLSATLCMGWFTASPAEYKALGLDTIAGALFVPNLVFWNDTGYFGHIADRAPLLHLWSLGIEEQFYLVWPCLLVLLVRHFKVRPAPVLATLGAISLVYSSVAAFHDPAASFYSPFSRMWELGVGGILASLRVETRYPETLALGGFVAIISAAFALSDASVFPGLLALVPVAGTAMMIAGRSRLLAKPIFVAFGLISYPLYLWHWPLLVLTAALDFHTELAKAIAVAFSVILAWLTARYVEHPVRFGSWRRSGLAVSAAATVAVCIAGLVIFEFRGVPQRYPADIAAMLDAADFQYPPSQCWIHNDADFSTFDPQCRDGAILIWGDSYSGALATGLPKPHAQFSRNACLPLLTEGTDECAKSNVKVVAEILRLKPQRVILFGRWLFQVTNWQSDSSLDQPLRDTLHKLHSGVDDVVVIGPVPLWIPSAPDLIYSYWRSRHVLPDRLSIPTGDYRASEQVMRSIAASEGVQYVSILDALCNSEGCLTHTPASRADLLIWDNGHLTIDGAKFVVEQLGLARTDAPTGPP